MAHINAKPKVFISYIKEDQEMAQTLYECLRKANCDPWMDDFKMGPGVNWERAIKEAIDKSDFFISCFSSELVEKWESYFWKELHLAIEKTKRRPFDQVYLIPARFNACEIPQEVSAYQVVDLFNKDDINQIIGVIKGEFSKSEITDHRQNRNHVALDPVDIKIDQAAAGSTDPPPAYQYDGLFKVASRSFPYISFIGIGNKGDNEYQKGDVISQTVSADFQLPEDFEGNPIPNHQQLSENKCRINHYDHVITSQPNPDQLRFGFSRIEYKDYLKSGECLDHPIAGYPHQTFRQKFAPKLDLDSYLRSPLTNICGVGVFILTRDRKIIISKHSPNVIVHKNVWSYSASGTMDWQADVHPFDEIARECKEEIRHQINLDHTYLFGIGIDTKRLYFQFSFLERSGLTAGEIVQRAPLARDYHAEINKLEIIPFDLGLIVRIIEDRNWEPSAAVALITLCIKEFGLERVEKAIDSEYVQRRFKKAMAFEWNQRALRPGELAVMSGRYPFSQCTEASHKYIHAVTDFIGNDVDGKNVLELGCGIGRLTKWLVDRAGEITCLDISEKMLERNRHLLGNLSEKVVYLRMLGQEYTNPQKHDVAISSLVLIHNVADDAFNKLASVISGCADTIFLFEHVGEDSKEDPTTRLRTEKALGLAFSKFNTEKREVYKLFDDNIIFLKLSKTKGSYAT